MSDSKVTGQDIKNNIITMPKMQGVATSLPTSIATAPAALYNAEPYTSGAWNLIAEMYSVTETPGVDDAPPPMDQYSGLLDAPGNKLQNGGVQTDDPKEEDHLDLPDWINNGVDQLAKGLGDVWHWIKCIGSA